MGTTTTTFALNKPTVGGDDNAWGTDWNTNADKLDDLLDGTTAIKPNLSEGLWKVGGVAVTATAAEINVLDGVTASAAELNILDGATLTVTELNYVDGVTSAIQTQLDAKYDSGDLASQAEAEAGTDNTKLMTPLRLRNALNATGTAPVYACRAWVNFNGTGTVAIRASGNVSSITDNGTGDYSVNFATAMPDANYGFQVTPANTTGSSIVPQVGGITQASGSLRFQLRIQNGTLQDWDFVNVSIFR